MADDAMGLEQDLGFDPDVLRDKYRQERDKRVRTDGQDQYVQPSGDLARFYDDDPYVSSDYTRAPLNDEVEVLIIGGGFAGLVAAARMREEGLTDIRIVESGADFGGTWYWNRYPGAQCDVDSYCYLPLLEETGYMPKEKYSFAPEIFEHARRIATTFNLYDFACFRTRVTELRWDEDLARWIVSTNHNDAMKARFVVMAIGPAARLKLPGIPGLATFAGKSFHTARWDYGYTGGDTTGNLDKLGDKRVAVIGTGATGIQCVPHVGETAKQLYVFQRTPNSVDLRGNKPTDPEWVKSLKPGWQQERQENFNEIFSGRPFEVDLVNDAWTDAFRTVQSLMSRAETMSPEEAGRLFELVDFQKMNQIRARVDATVEDKAVAEQLKAWYRQFCKRPGFSDTYLPTFNRPNVTLVDTSPSKGVERITRTGVVANGVEYEVDCIIFASGFEVGSAYKRRIGIEIFGRDGRSLYDHWTTSMRTLHGHSTHGFPNWFFIGVGQNGGSFNFSSMIGEQARQITYIINEVRSRGLRTVQPTPQAEAEWVATIRELAGQNKAFLESCTPGFYNSEGHFDENAPSFFGDNYAPGVNAFNVLLREWRQTGGLEGLELA
jgi:cyclohexanone monooxygenase